MLAEIINMRLSLTPRQKLIVKWLIFSRAWRILSQQEKDFVTDLCYRDYELNFKQNIKLEEIYLKARGVK